MCEHILLFPATLFDNLATDCNSIPSAQFNGYFREPRRAKLEIKSMKLEPNLSEISKWYGFFIFQYNQNIYSFPDNIMHVVDTFIYPHFQRNISLKEKYHIKCVHNILSFHLLTKTSILLHSWAFFPAQIQVSL